MGRAFLPFELAMQRLAEFADFKLHTLRCSSCANVYLLGGVRSDEKQKGSINYPLLCCCGCASAEAPLLYTFLKRKVLPKMPSSAGHSDGLFMLHGFSEQLIINTDVLKIA
ncbi:hypothetical protein D918_07975 [Trichuris suis]|nr:hypothetical protein D918_07975 [Trichuris suis]